MTKPKLNSKFLAIAAVSISMLNSRQASAAPAGAQPIVDFNTIKQLVRKKLKPKLTLRLNPYRPENSRLVFHGSHSSHSSHVSHASHSSGGGGFGLIVGGALLYGAYRIGKSRSKP